MNKKIHNLLKIENDKTTIFTNKELKMIDDYINELESYKYNLDRDYLRLEKENQELKEVIEKAIKYIEYNNETLYTYEPDYDYEENIVDNYDISSYREDLLEILKGGENE